MALSNTATPIYYGQFRDAVIRGEIPVCKEISMEMNRIDALIANPGIYYDDEAINGFFDEVPLPQESQDIQLIKDDSAGRDVTRHIEYKVQDVDKVLEQYIGVIKDAGYKVYDKEAYSKINSEYEFTADYEFRMHKKFYAESGDIVVCVKLDRTNGRIILDMKME